MKYTFTYKTTIEAPIDDVWDFFSTAENLAKITSFPKIKIESDPRTMQGNEIVMSLGFSLIRMKWISLIEDVEAPLLFVDKGLVMPFPFTYWKHKHAFERYEDRPDKTLMTDSLVVEAYLPEKLIHLFLNQMFKGREKALKEVFHS
ncbi:SRPBCC family protein [Bacillus suaedae]|uniref:SRPBCC family protein n=1 Tax=Halalkalibacter suaedae TaxID=2822140 RepID=A0A940WYX0_9BACI|nr:hypothetical protein [Bacillus suaedae]MBP3951195.1 hypothetical protein [Bacillus suaedae]